MGKYRTKPVNPGEVEAIVWTGDNWRELEEWGCKSAQTQDDELLIPMNGLILNAKVGDYIIKANENSFYPCDPETFEAVYEPIGRE